MQLLAQYNSLAGSAEGDGGATQQEQQDGAGASTPAAGTGDAPAGKGAAMHFKLGSRVEQCCTAHSFRARRRHAPMQCLRWPALPLHPHRPVLLLMFCFFLSAVALPALAFAVLLFVDARMAYAGEQGTAGAEVVVADGGGGGAAAEGGVEGPVCAEQQESVLGVQLKVEVLTALVSKMEHLVGRAEATARALQVGLHPVRERGGPWVATLHACVAAWTAVVLESVCVACHH